MKMDPARREALRQPIADFDAKMRHLADLGVDRSRPWAAIVADLRARRDELRRQHDELEAMQQEADSQLLAALIDLYIDGDDGDREWVRELLQQHRTFRWGFGWGLAANIASREDARRALAVLSMKDGSGDYRDDIVALDRYCAAMTRAGLPVADLLREAAAWSSDVSWFPPMSSTRARLLARAERFEQSSP